MAAAGKGNALGGLSLPAKLAVGLVVMGLVAGVYFIIFYTDVDGQISQAITAEQNLRGELQKAEEAKQAYQRDVEDKTRRQQMEREQKKVLPDESETPSFLAAIQGVATTSGVTLVQYKPEDEVPQEFYVKVPMSLSLRGRFHQIARFFFGVGQLDRVANIEDLQIQFVTGSPKEGSDEVLLDVQCLATAFRAKRVNEVAKARPQ